MATRIIPINGGRVTSRDPSTLDAGELTQAEDCYYKPYDPGLWKVAGRTAFNSSAEASRILGIRFLEYDSSTDKIVTVVGGTYRVADASLTGAFSDLATGLNVPTTLDSLHYDRLHYLFDGTNQNRSVASDGTIVLQGMAANTTAPTIARDAGVGGGMTITNETEITYWVEERVKDGDTIVKRSADTGSTVATLVGDGSTDQPVITRPTTVNSDATHWALFATSSGGTFPTGAEIEEVAIATTTIEDTRTGSDPEIPGGTVYEVHSVSIAGVTSNVARNGPAPIAKTGDVFEDSIVTDDASRVSRLRYTFPDEPHKFPAHNYVDFNTKDEDEVALIRRLGNVVIVLLRDSVWRLNYLPRAQDASFDRGRMKDKVVGAFGCVGPLAGDTFSFGQGDLLAYVSRYGILTTDGYRWDVLTDDIAWEEEVDITKLGSSVLINNPRDYRLEFYYTSNGGSDNDRCAYLHYHPSHIKQRGSDKRLKVTFPINAAAPCATRVVLSGIHHIYTGNDDGVVYVENEGLTDASAAGGITMVVRSSDIAMAGNISQSKVNRMWAHHDARPGQTATYRLIERNEGEVDTMNTALGVDLTYREASQAGLQGQAEFFQLGFENSDSIGTIRLDYFAVDVVHMGESEAG